jgi:methionyl-tRNA formyltransferase
LKTAYDIIFMGTPEFAVPALKALVAAGHRIPLVVTQPDRPKGRGKKLIAPPVKEAATAMGLATIQPESIDSKNTVKRISNPSPEFIVVVAFGQVLPQKILALPRYGAINIHASLLPAYRGPAPIQWAIINGEKETGVTTMFMDSGVDTGDILLTGREEIMPDDTAATLHDRLAERGATLLIRTLNALVKNKISAKPQDHSQATYAPLLKKKDGLIDWDKSATFIDAFIRGMTPWPGAFTFYQKHRLKIFKAFPLAADIDHIPGTVLESFPDELRVATGEGALRILEIQGASGKRLPIPEFLRGHPIPAGAVFR